jgi:ABC-type transport system involved in multi-copper enzyme maturation permease subunit
MWNVFLGWRRTMSKVLLGLLLGAYALLVLGLLLLYALAAANGDNVTGVRGLLTFPTSLALPGALVRYLAPIFAAILAGALVGGEYAFGTYRLSLARGSSRAQVLGGQILAMAFIALIVSALMLALGLLVGVTLGPLLGSDLVIPYPDGWVQILWYWLALSLNIWGYMLVALFFATLGRSAAAGIGGALVVFIVEIVLTLLVFPLVTVILGALHLTYAADIFSQAPNFLLGHALAAVVTYSQLRPIQLAPDAPTEPFAAALLVALVYCAALIAASYAIFKQRDIAE